MDIKRMHDMIEKLSECAKSEFEKGIENVNTDEMGKVTDMLKDLAEAMYYRTLTNIMEESGVEDALGILDRRFYDDYRYKTTGRYAPKGKGSYVGRRGYEEPPYMHMMNMEDLQDWDSMSERERMRDLDRASRGRMYYTETEPMHKDGGMRDSREGKAGMMRKGYMETKEMHKGTTPQDKEANMHSLESYLKELSEDLTELLPYMIPEERQMAKTRITTLAAKM
jgi:hypothetical protein|nr:MAG TPA: hypothetical protein [Bacteriophage sp.]